MTSPFDAIREAMESAELYATSCAKDDECPMCDAYRSITENVDAAEAAYNKLYAESFTLAANQCHDGYAGEGGNHRCRENDELRAHVADLEDIVSRYRNAR